MIKTSSILCIFFFHWLLSCLKAECSERSMFFSITSVLLCAPLLHCFSKLAPIVNRGTTAERQPKWYDTLIWDTFYTPFEDRNASKSVLY